MVKKFKFGKPYETMAVVEDIALSDISELKYLSVSEVPKGGYLFTAQLRKLNFFYGLGEATRGINKRGWIYTSYNEDNPNINDCRTSLYAAHNFYVVSGENSYGAFFDFPSKVVFDFGYSELTEYSITCSGDGYLYIIEGDSLNAIVKEFRSLIGQSYIPPKWAFGIGQSRWGYKSADDVRYVLRSFRKHELPVDMIYLDIDHMQDYKDFTVNDRSFPDFADFVQEMKAEHVRLIPIVDAGVKVEKGYKVYDEGKRLNYFCKDRSDDDYVIGVWPGDSVLPDFLNKRAANWFGEQYKFYLDSGIEGFWNDMNEPAIFYSRDRLCQALSTFKTYNGRSGTEGYERVKSKIFALGNTDEIYTEFYHSIGTQKVPHYKVHNLYGYKMTKAAADYFKRYNPDKRYLLFSRSSYIGMHRYGGIWTGDNASTWAHLLLNLQMLPSLNMCGFLYVGADIGGFGGNSTAELMLRWMSLAAFTPLYRNHSTQNSRHQEFYEFGAFNKFRLMLQWRYRLLPFVYSEFVKAALNSDMLFKPLTFLFPEDRFAMNIEDEVMMGDSILIAPVYTQNAIGRYVYLPEDMLEVRLSNVGIKTRQRKNGHNYVIVAPDHIVFFLRQGKVVPFAEPADCVENVDFNNLTFVKNITEETTYTVCMDDGETTDNLRKYMKEIVVKP